MKNPKESNGFTLLEIVIAIIILGIVLSAFPSFFLTSGVSQKALIKEEVFFEEFSLLNTITSRYFDENSTKGENFYKDLNATAGDSELYNNYSSPYAGETSRIGKSQINNNIFRSGSSDEVSIIMLDSDENSSDIATYDDIDDFNDYNKTYLDKYLIKVEVKYINDDANFSDNNISFTYNYDTEKNFTNIKLITVKCKVNGSEVVLKYPFNNIGASKFLSLEEIIR